MEFEEALLHIFTISLPFLKIALHQILLLFQTEAFTCIMVNINLLLV